MSAPEDVAVTMTTDEKLEQTTDDKVKDNPYIENAAPSGVTLNIGPKVRLVPKPFKKIKHVIIASYLCMIFGGCLPGIFANSYAWQAKRMKESGQRSEAKTLARESVRCIYVGLGVFILGIIGAIIAISLHFTTPAE